ncbi:MAG: GTP-binding protein [Ktedonobacteraceae bacterium]
MMKSASSKCLVTIVTGFLGSGKTTLLTRVLSEPSLHNTAVLVNEFGKIGLDHHLLRQVNEHTILLGNGCACCTRREDLVQTLLELLALDERGDITRLERVIIETSGLADPAPMHFTILTHPVLQHHFFIDRVITTIDAVNGHLHLDRHAESQKQVASADTIIITKADLVSATGVDELTRRLHTLNPVALIVQAAYGEVDSNQLFSSKEMGTPAEDAKLLANLQKKPLDKEQHISNTHSISLLFQEPLDWRAFGLWLSMLLYARGEDILRVKGLLDIGEAGPIVLNGVQHIIHPPQHLERWPSIDRSSQLIFITRGINPQVILTSLRVFHHALAAELTRFEVHVHT